MWRLSFSPYLSKETVGSIIAAYTDNGIVMLEYSGSVNLDNPGSVADFLAQAKKALSAVSANTTAQTDLDTKLATIEAGLNK